MSDHADDDYAGYGEILGRLEADNQRLKDVAETLTSVPLTWHPRGEAERASFDVTLRAYQLALAAVREENE